MADILAVQNYTNTYNSYINRLIPYHNRKDYIDFLTRFYVTHGYLRGSLAKISAFLTPSIQITTGNRKLKETISNIFEDLDVTSITTDIILNTLVYDEVVVLYFPAQSLSMKCPSCKTKFKIDDSYKYSFKIVSLADLDQKFKATKASRQVPYEVQRDLVPAYGLACTCPSCGTEFKQEPECLGDTDTPGVLKVMNPHHIRGFSNDAGKRFVKVDPEDYTGVLDLNTELRFHHIDGLPWQLIITYASKEMDYIPPKKYTAIFTNQGIAGLDGAGVSPLSGTVSDLMHIDILKLGNEGLAFSKVNPLYVMSPRGNTSAGANFDVVSHEDYRDFIVDEVQQRESGDFNRMVYSPISVTAEPVFGDGKRFLALQELMHFQENVIHAMGYNPDVLKGTVGVMNDPFTLKSIDNRFASFNKVATRLLGQILLSREPIYSREVFKANGKDLFILERPSLAKGTMSFQQKQEAMQAGLLPKSIILEDLGYPTPEAWYDRLREEALGERREQMKLNKAMGVLETQERMASQDNQAVTGSLDTSVAKSQIMSDAQMHLDQIVNMDGGQRKSYLAQLQNEDPVLYAVVSVQWRQYGNVQAAEAKAQQNQ